MDTPTVQSGIIGFFDILGYENYLHHNEPEEAAKTVLSFLPRAGSEAAAKFLRRFGNGKSTDSSLEARLKEIRWVVFSDTILASLSFSEEHASKDTNLACQLFSGLMLVFCRHMFESGLPLRGVLNFGEFVVQEACFAGRCIIEAYSFSKTIEAAACVIHPSSTEKFRSTRASIDHDNVALSYQVPTKDNSKDRLYTLNYMYLGKDFGFEDMTGKDIRQAVASSFWRHNKDLPQSVLNKLENTEVLIRFFKDRTPGQLFS